MQFRNANRPMPDLTLHHSADLHSLRLMQLAGTISQWQPLRYRLAEPPCRKVL